jgi:hypothetical protein
MLGIVRMRNISIRVAGYDVSIVVFILIGALLGTATAVAYMWNTKITVINVPEPLTITDYPATILTHPGENIILNITIVNTASVNYTVTLTLTLNDTAYQNTWVTFGTTTFNINPGTNQLTTTMQIARKAPSATLQLTTEFTRE